MCLSLRMRTTPFAYINLSPQYVPDGLWKSNWIKKHRSAVPSVVVAFFDLSKSTVAADASPRYHLPPPSPPPDPDPPPQAPPQSFVLPDTNIGVTVFASPARAASKYPLHKVSKALCVVHKVVLAVHE